MQREETFFLLVDNLYAVYACMCKDQILPLSACDLFISVGAKHANPGMGDGWKQG